MTQIFLSSTSASVQVETLPRDWSNTNTIEIVSTGVTGNTATSPTGGQGGFGGGYGKITNWLGGTPLGNVNFWITPPATLATVDGRCAWGGTTLGTNNDLVVGGGISGTISSPSGLYIVSPANKGGDPGTGGSISGGSGGGGGGAGGPSGTGTIGSNGSATAGGAGGGGGKADNSTVTGGTAGASGGGTGGAGNAGTEWPPNGVGSGGGGGGGSASKGTAGGKGGQGGLYGGGGGGGGGNSKSGTQGVGGVGQQGIIILTYTPAATPVTFDSILSFEFDKSFSFDAKLPTENLVGSFTPTAVIYGEYGGEGYNLLAYNDGPENPPKTLTYDGFCGIEILRKIQKNMGFPIENLCDVANDYRALKENTSKQQLDFSIPSEESRAYRSDQDIANESLRTIESDDHMLFEALSNKASNSISPTEFNAITATVLTNDGFVPIEYKAAHSGDNSLTVEEIAARKIDTVAPTEALSNVSAAGNVPSETLRDYRNDSDIQSENTKSYSTDISTPNENGSAYVGASQATTEFTADASFNATIPTEWTGTAAVSFVADGIVPIEWSVAFQCDILTKNEISRALALNAATPTENSSEYSSVSLLQNESTATYRNDNLAPSEMLSSSSFINVLPTENLLARDLFSSVPVELTAQFNFDNTAPTEWLGARTVTAEGVIPIEFTGFLRINADGIVPNEWYRAAAFDNKISGESVAARDFSSVAPTENVLGLRFDSNVAGEILRSFLANADMPGEWLRTAIANAQAPLEVISKLALDGVLPAEATLKLSFDSHSGAYEVTAAIRFDNLAPNESTLAVRLTADGIVPTEWGAALRLTVDGVLPIEWQLRTAFNSPVPFEITSSFVPLDPTRKYTRIADNWQYTASTLAQPGLVSFNYSVIADNWQYTFQPPESAMPALKPLPPIDAVNQVQTCAADFGLFLPAGITLIPGGTTPPTVTIQVMAGIDPTPNVRLSGGPQIGTVPLAQGGTNVANAALLQQLEGLVGGVTYLLWFYCSRSDGDVASGWTKVQAVTPGPPLNN